MISEKFPVDFVVFPESAEAHALLQRFSETQRIFFSTGLPKNFLGPLYSAAEQLTIVEVPPLRRAIRFGNSTHFSDGLFLNPITGEVVEVASGEVRLFVNSSLKQFGQTVTAVVERFPFYSSHDEDEKLDEDMDAAVRNLSAIICRIDPPAIDVDLFWSTFVDDVSIGDYSTKDVLSRRPNWHGEYIIGVGVVSSSDDLQL
jgi:hypothetical protein